MIFGQTMLYRVVQHGRKL